MFKNIIPNSSLMDINMPIMDGYEATKEIRKFSTKVPIIAVHCICIRPDEQKVMENGSDAYMANRQSPPIN